MKIKILFLCIFFSFSVNAYELFNKDEPIQDGINIYKVSNMFSEIYEKLDNISWGGKSIDVAIEGIQNIDKNIQITSTNERIILIFKDKVISNYPKPESKNWYDFGQITTALILKIRELIPRYKNIDEKNIYKLVVDSLIKSLDEKGNYIFSKTDEIYKKDKILTSLGIEGVRNSKKEFIITGVYNGSVADLKGIEKNNIILSINGKNIKNISDKELNNFLHGFDSGVLKLKIANNLGVKDFILSRASIILADTDIVIRKDEKEKISILEIIVHNLTNNSFMIIKDALNKYSDISGVILDLRNAIGNDEDSATKISGLFLGKVPVMKIFESNKELEFISNIEKLNNTPIVVLTSNSTSGTAEILAYNLYYNNAGLIIGTPTSGMLRLSSVIDLKNGGSLELFNKYIRTYEGKDLNNIGVFPIVCLSNIRSKKEQDVFFLNVINENFNAKDFNILVSKENVNKIKKQCSSFINNFDEDSISRGLSVKILSDKKIYNKLIKRDN